MDSLNDASVKKYWFDNVFNKWNTFAKLPVVDRQIFIDFINTFETPVLFSFNQDFIDKNKATDLINKFPGIVNPKQDPFVALVQTNFLNWTPDQIYTAYNILKDYYAIILLAVYYSDPIVSKIVETKERLYQAQLIAASNYNEALKRNINYGFNGITFMPQCKPVRTPDNTIILNTRDGSDNTGGAGTDQKATTDKYGNKIDKVDTPLVEASFLDSMSDSTKILLGLGIFGLLAWYISSE